MYHNRIMNKYGSSDKGHFKFIKYLNRSKSWNFKLGINRSQWKLGIIEYQRFAKEIIKENR